MSFLFPSVLFVCGEGHLSQKAVFENELSLGHTVWATLYQKIEDLKKLEHQSWRYYPKASNGNHHRLIYHWMIHYWVIH